MTESKFSHQQDYLLCLRGFHRLHALTLSGRDQTDEANEIRASMEQAWWHLSDVEQERLDGLSEDLYDLSDVTIDAPHELESESTDLNHVLIELSEAEDNEDWDLALATLRRIKSSLKPPRLDFWRGCIWKAAGDQETASLFFQHAATILPDYPVAENLDLLDVKFYFGSKIQTPTGT